MEPVLMIRQCIFTFTQQHLAAGLAVVGLMGSAMDADAQDRLRNSQALSGDFDVTVEMEVAELEDEAGLDLLRAKVKKQGVTHETVHRYAAIRNRLEKTLARLDDASDEEQAELEQRVREHVGRLFDQQMESQQQEIERLQKRLEQIQRKMEKAHASRDRWVKSRAEALVRGDQKERETALDRLMLPRIMPLEANVQRRILKFTGPGDANMMIQSERPSLPPLAVEMVEIPGPPHVPHPELTGRKLSHSEKELYQMHLLQLRAQMEMQEQSLKALQRAQQQERDAMKAAERAMRDVADADDGDDEERDDESEDEDQPEEADEDEVDADQESHELGDDEQHEEDDADEDADDGDDGDDGDDDDEEEDDEEEDDDEDEVEGDEDE
jgi:tetrahydromethanopterin S-methyltransferase subunit G